MTATEKMPASCWGKYGKVAIVKLEDGFEGIPKMISERAIGVAEIVKLWDKLHVGKTESSAYYRAIDAAINMCAELNMSNG